MAYALSKGTPTITITFWGLQFQHLNFGRTPMFRPQQSPSVGDLKSLFLAILTILFLNLPLLLDFILGYPYVTFKCKTHLFICLFFSSDLSTKPTMSSPHFPDQMPSRHLLLLSFCFFPLLCWPVKHSALPIVLLKRKIPSRLFSPSQPGLSCLLLALLLQSSTSGLFSLSHVLAR